MNHKCPAVGVDSTASAARNARASFHSVSTRFHRGAGISSPTCSTLHALATKMCDSCGLRAELCFVTLLLIGSHVATGAPLVDPPEKLQQLGGLTIDVPRKRVTLCGWVNQTEGPIEYVICSPHGKTHESIFVSEEPLENLQAAILLLGVKPGVSSSGQGRGQPAGPAFEIWVKWENCGGAKQLRVEAMMYNHRAKSVLPDTTWIFTGSKVEDGMFKANVYGSYAVVYWDPWAIFNINHDVGKDDDALSVHTKSVPPKDTNVKLEFRYVGEAE